MARIELEHVTKRYPGGVPAVNDLSLDISDGDFMVLVGPSGSGKPTACGWSPAWRTSPRAIMVGHAFVRMSGAGTTSWRSRHPRTGGWPSRSANSSLPSDPERRSSLRHAVDRLVQQRPSKQITAG
jgi:ABC-type dipeptide/oligopeptide/nickel transport system ATPase component